MIYGSICSGIESASLALEPLGWQPRFFSEIESSPCAVLRERWPGVPLHGDFRTIKKDSYEKIDALIGGTPCQDFSLAGLRKGLAGDRGVLTIEFVKLLKRLGPDWFLFENVPGILSNDKGKAFGLFLGRAAGYPKGHILTPPQGGWGNTGIVRPATPQSYGLAWRVLDAQYFRVAQRRRRVFVVGYIGDWRPPAAVFLEWESLSGNPPPSRKARQGTARGFEVGPHAGNFTNLAATLDTKCKDGPIRNQIGNGVVEFASEEVARTLTSEGSDGSYTADGRGNSLVSTFRMQAFGEYSDDDTASTLKARDHKDATDLVAFDCKGTEVENRGDGLTPTLRAQNSRKNHQNGGGQIAVAFESRIARNGRGGPEDIVPPLKAQSGKTGKGDSAPLVAFGISPDCFDRSGECSDGSASGRSGLGVDEEVSYALRAKRPSGVATYAAVRRLTPRECERLQGMPDDHTLVPIGKSKGGKIKMMSDAGRYKGVGNAMAVPAIQWIGRRMDLIDKLVKGEKCRNR